MPVPTCDGPDTESASSSSVGVVWCLTLLWPLAGGIGSGATKAPCRVSVCRDNIFLRRISALVSRPHSSLASRAVDSPGPTAGLTTAPVSWLVDGKLVLYDVEPNTGTWVVFLMLNAFLLAIVSSSSSELPLKK